MLLKDKIVVISGIGPGLGVKLASRRRARRKSSTTPKRGSAHSARTATC